MTVLRCRADSIRWASVLLGSLALGVSACDRVDAGAGMPPQPPAARAAVPGEVPAAVPPAPALPAPPHPAVAPTQPAIGSAVVDPSAPGPGENGTPSAGPAYVGPITQGINTDQSLPAHPVRGPTASLPQGTRQIGH